MNVCTQVKEQRGLTSLRNAENSSNCWKKTPAGSPWHATGRPYMEKRLLLVLLAFALFALGFFIHSHGGLPNWLPR